MNTESRGRRPGRAVIWRPATLLLLALIPALAAAGRWRSAPPPMERPLAGAPRGGGAGPAPDRAVAVTFDDVPGVAAVAGACDIAGLRDLTDRLLEALDRTDVPATAFVVGSRVCDAHRVTLLPELLARWRAAGHGIGNHTFSHRDLNAVELDWYTADIGRNQRLLDPLLVPGEPRWFRPPLLHSGDSPSKKAGLRAYLDHHGYRMAPLTVDNQEWIFADVYVRAKAAGDTAVMRRVAGAYVPFMDSVIAFFEQRSVAVLGREIPQVLLLHANELNADHFPALAAMMRRRGYRFVTLEEAVSDPAYSRTDPYVGPRGLSWIHRWGLDAGMELAEEPREPGWLVELRRSYGEGATGL
jgi:peptidoglycan/xylan/chitin deacetylase (PgdA/CDA1 family)